MLDIKFIRENPKLVEEGCEKKGIKIDLGLILKTDEKRRKVSQAVEEIRFEKNKANELIKKSKDQKEKIISQMRKLNVKESKLNKELKVLQEKTNKLLRAIPNIPFEEVPVGKDETENVVLKEVGKKTDFDFNPREYLEVAEKLDLIDVKRAAKVSGARFGFLKNQAVLLEFALVNLALEKTMKHGFAPVVPPVLIRPEMMEGMGYTERGKDEIYYLEKDNLFLIGTSEQIIGPMHSGEIFDAKELPKRYVGFSACFRREAGSYGKDTKGILRVHQFDKLEMFSFCEPHDSKQEHKLMLSIEEELMQELGLPYRVINICTGDLGDPAAAKYDIEVWLPFARQYRETHSTSNCTDYQARRLNIRYRKNGKLDFVHMLNGTAFAVGRILIALIENNQQKDGSVKIPQALHKYLPFKDIK